MQLVLDVLRAAGEAQRFDAGMQPRRGCHTQHRAPLGSMARAAGEAVRGLATASFSHNSCGDAFPLFQGLLFLQPTGGIPTPRAAFDVLLRRCWTEWHSE